MKGSKTPVTFNSASVPNSYLAPILRDNPVAMSGQPFFLRGNEASDLIKNEKAVPGFKAVKIGSDNGLMTQFKLVAA